MSTAIPTLKLQLNKRELTLLVPLYITGMVALISVLIAFLFWRGGSIPGTEVWVESSRANPGIAYSLPGFLATLGVTAVSTTFPFALSLGATRRGFTIGTLMWQVLISAYLTIVLGVLMLIEVATGHWFSNFYIFDVNVLGAGNLAQLIPNVFLGTLSVMAISGVMGASWVRFGARGPQAIGLAVAIVVVAALIILIPSAEQIFAAFQLWWLGVLAVAVIVLSSVGTWLFLRPATVR